MIFRCAHSVNKTEFLESWVTNFKNCWSLFSNYEFVNSVAIFVIFHMLLGPTAMSRPIPAQAFAPTGLFSFTFPTTQSHVLHHFLLSPAAFSLSLYLSFFLLSPSPSNKPTFLYKFFYSFLSCPIFTFPLFIWRTTIPIWSSPSKRKPKNPTIVKNETQQLKTTRISPFERKPRNPAATMKTETQQQLTEALPLSIVLCSLLLWIFFWGICGVKNCCSVQIF